MILLNVYTIPLTRCLQNWKIRRCHLTKDVCNLLEINKVHEEKMHMNKNITYTSDKGYIGTLYGTSSLSVRNSDGEELFHTGSRNIHTFSELVAFVNSFPDFYETIISIYGKDSYE